MLPATSRLPALDNYTSALHIDHHQLSLGTPARFALIIQPGLISSAPDSQTMAGPTGAHGHGGHPIHVHPARPLYRFFATGLGASMWFFVWILSLDALPTLTGVTVDVPREEGRRCSDGLEAPLGPLNTRWGSKRSYRNNSIFHTELAHGYSMVYICADGQAAAISSALRSWLCSEILRPFRIRQCIHNRAKSRAANWKLTRLIATRPFRIICFGCFVKLPFNREIKKN